MIGHKELKELMRRHLENDRANDSVEASGGSLEEALGAAAEELGVRVRDLEYELLEEGAKGAFGVGKKPWRISAYPALKKEKAPELETEEVGYEAAVPEVPVEVDRNGDCFVNFSNEGVLAKVTPPAGKGRRAAEKQLADRLRQRGVHQYDEELVARLVREADGKYWKVGEFIHNPSNDAIMTVDITDGEMRASLYATPPGPGGCDLSAEAILSFLRNNRIVYGVKEDAVQEFQDRPRYKEMVVVAEGKKPEPGRDACVKYNFATDHSQVKLKEVNGKVNFKELNIVQNVVEGQPLARKMPPEKGEPGFTVTGKMLPTKAGKDIPSPVGKNAHIAEDGCTIVSDMNGQVIILGGRINVEPIYTVQGDVDLHTGNIIFLGTVLVKGNVEDGFTVKAAGNIEVTGNIGKCELDAEGDIIVHQGINGKGAGSVRSGRSVWAKFIQNARVEAAEYVVVSDGIMNSEVTSNKKIVCQGKRAAIVGGHLRAAEEINAKQLGSEGGNETILEVGYDPKSKEKLDGLNEQIAALRKQLEEADLNVATLANLKKQKKQLSDEKEAFLQEQLSRKQELGAAIANLGQEVQAVQDYLGSLKLKGRISASGKVYPGTKIIIRDVREEIKSDYSKSVTFILDNNLIRATKYEELEEDLEKKRDDASKAD